jgi:hypothetical protein
MKRIWIALAVGSVLLAPGASPPGLVAWWSFDDDAARAVDIAGGRAAAVRGAPETVRPGCPGGSRVACMQFDPARRTHLVVDGEGLPGLVGSFTVEAWIRPRSDPPKWLRIASRTQEGNGFQLCYGAYEQVGFAVWRNGVRWQIRNARHPKDQWIHVAGVWDERAMRMRLFVNGEEVFDDAEGATEYVETHGDLLIGARGDDCGFFDGDMDDVRLWDYARPPGHIRAYLSGELAVGPTG